jgi:tRNA threonylcarbamoyladenosine modification (KEOPS) complex Cgi121 subunit
MTAEPIAQLDPLADEIDEPIVVQGARGSYEREALIDALAAASADREAHLQAFDPEAVYGAEHVAAAARRALRSHAEDRAIARDPAVEIACYAASTDQIEDALAAVGVPAEGQAVVVCSVGADASEALDAALAELGLESADDVIGRDERALDRIGVSTAMRENVPGEGTALALEHVALLDAKR